MKVKIAEYIANFFVDNRITEIFTVTGGGAMHLNDALGHNEGLHCIYNHHEQACAIAAEGYTRLSRRLAVVCVTSGPGGTNAITGVLGGWLDSIPMFIISGQVKRETSLWATDVPLRQLGDQEYNIIESVKPMTKYAAMVINPKEIRYHLEKALYLCRTGRGGPVWLDIPLDVQAAVVESNELTGFNPLDEPAIAPPIYNTDLTSIILEKIKNAKRPAILAGTGIRLGNAAKEFHQLINELQIPVLTAWNAHDLIDDDHHLNCGRPGTVGTRGGNFVLQNCDLLIVLGCRLNIRMVSYNYHEFAKNAYKIIVDIDKFELLKPTVRPDLAVCADVKEVLSDLIASLKLYNYKIHENWLKWCFNINKKYSPVLPSYYEDKNSLNPYAFIYELSCALSEEDTVVCGNGSACVVTFQAAKVKSRQRYFTNSGCAAMGYGIPAAIGACFTDRTRRVICIDGDGSFQMNIQELQTIVHHHLNLKIIYLNNNGYHSIRQTQENIFGPELVGVQDGTGISFPSAEKIAAAYDIPYMKIDSLNNFPNNFQKVLDIDGPVLCEAVLDSTQKFEPKLSSKRLPDGQMVSASIDDMYPFLPREEYECIKKSVGDLDK